MSNRNAEIAKTILQQLGGNMFTTMTGSRDFAAVPDDLTFKIGRNAKGVTHVTILLTPADLYKMEFIRVRGMSAKVVSTHDDIFADQMGDIIELETGLKTTLF
ncbi:hypothetical protein EBZ39_13255 [bacterium]|nr:hypothetical protein [bacterium]